MTNQPITHRLPIDFIDVIDLLRLETMISLAQPIRKMNKKGALACENSRFSSLIAAGDVSQGGTSATQSILMTQNCFRIRS